MTLFQVLAVSVLAALVAWEVFLLLRRGWRGAFPVVRTVVWLAAALAIAFPMAVQTVAVWLGIGRGADVVLYVSVLGFLGLAFYLYARQIRLHRQLTEVVRHLAIQDARRGGPG
jgi:hypothetical protein